MSCYRISDPDRPEGRAIHPFTYIMNTENPDLDAAIERFLHNVDMGAVDALIDGVPEEAFGMIILPDGMRESHKLLLRERIARGFVPAYRKIAAERPENLRMAPLSEADLASLERRGTRSGDPAHDPADGPLARLDGLEAECGQASSSVVAARDGRSTAR